MKQPRLFEPAIEIPEELRPAVDLWLAYKKRQFRFTYTDDALGALVDRMAEMGPERAMAAVKWSMGGSGHPYKGLFEPPKSNHQQPAIELSPGVWICSRCGRSSGIEFENKAEGVAAGWYVWEEDGSGKDRGLSFRRIGALRFQCPECR